MDDVRTGAMWLFAVTAFAALAGCGDSEPVSPSVSAPSEPAAASEPPPVPAPLGVEPKRTRAPETFALHVIEIEPDPDRDRLFVTFRNDTDAGVTDATVVCQLLDQADDVIAQGRAPAEPIGPNESSSPNLIRLSGDFDRVELRTRSRCRVEQGDQHSDWKIGWIYRS